MPVSSRNSGSKVSSNPLSCALVVVASVMVEAIGWDEQPAARTMSTKPNSQVRAQVASEYLSPGLVSRVLALPSGASEYLSPGHPTSAIQWKGLISIDHFSANEGGGSRVLGTVEERFSSSHLYQ